MRQLSFFSASSPISALKRLLADFDLNIGFQHIFARVQGAVVVATERAAHDGQGDAVHDHSHSA